MISLAETGRKTIGAGLAQNGSVAAFPLLAKPCILHNMLEMLPENKAQWTMVAFSKLQMRLPEDHSYYHPKHTRCHRVPLRSLGDPPFR